MCVANETQLLQISYPQNPHGTEDARSPKGVAQGRPKRQKPVRFPKTKNYEQAFVVSLWRLVGNLFISNIGLHRYEKVNGGLSFSVKIQCFPCVEVCLCMISLKRNHTFVNECVEVSDERSESQYNEVVSSTHSHTPRVCKLLP